MVRIHEGSPLLTFIVLCALVAQLVERYPYKVDVISSSLIATTIYNVNYAVVVQLVRIPACHAGGREFESRPPRHYTLCDLRLAQLVEQFPFKEWAHKFESIRVTTFNK